MQKTIITFPVALTQDQVLKVCTWIIVVNKDVKQEDIEVRVINKK